MRFYLLLFAGGLIFQGVLWSLIPLVDAGLWHDRIITLHGEIRSGALNAVNPIYSGHPGMPVVSLGALLYGAGLSPYMSLNIAVAILIAGAGAVSAWLATLFVPGSWRWLPVLAAAWGHPLYADSSPTNAVMAGLALVIVLSALRLCTHTPSDNRLLLAAGAAAGLALVTRTPAACIIILPLAVMVGLHLRARRVLVAAMAAGITAFVFDPLLWRDPAAHMHYIVFRSSLNYTAAVPDHQLTYVNFLYDAPFSLLAVALAVFIMTRAKARSFSLPSLFLPSLLAMSALYVSVFLGVRSQSIRHFLPLILVWDALLPLLIFTLIDRLPRAPRRRLAEAGVTICLTASPLVLLMHALF